MNEHEHRWDPVDGSCGVYQCRDCPQIGERDLRTGVIVAGRGHVEAVARWHDSAWAPDDIGSRPSRGRRAKHGGGR